MAWPKVKNIIILILLGMNLCLAGFSIDRMMQARHAQIQARSDAIAFLESREIHVEESVVPRTIALPSMWISRDIAAEERLAERLLNGTVETEAKGAEIYRYSNQNGWIQFHSSGEFSAQILSNVMRASDSSLEEYSQEVLERLEFQGELQEKEELDGWKYFMYQEYWGDTPLFNCQVVLSYQGDVLRSVSGERRLVGTPVEDSSAQTGSVSTALMRFYHAVSALGDVCSEIQEIVPGYILTTTIGKNMPLTPVWRIKTDIYTYQMELQSGTLSRIS